MTLPLVRCEVYLRVEWLVSPANPRLLIVGADLVEAMRVAFKLSRGRTPLLVMASRNWSADRGASEGADVFRFVVDPYTGQRGYQLVVREFLQDNEFVFVYPLMG